MPCPTFVPYDTRQPIHDTLPHSWGRWRPDAVHHGPPGQHRCRFLARGACGGLRTRTPSFAWDAKPDRHRVRDRSPFSHTRLSSAGPVAPCGRYAARRAQRRLEAAGMAGREEEGGRNCRLLRSSRGLENASRLQSRRLVRRHRPCPAAPWPAPPRTARWEPALRSCRRLFPSWTSESSRAGPPAMIKKAPGARRADWATASYWTRASLSTARPCG